jgi:hypothetical protein
MPDKFAGLGLLKSHLNRLARVPSQASPEVARALTALLRQQALSGTDPYGRAHAPLKRPRRSGRAGPPLVDSGESYGATGVKPTRGAGVGVTLGGALKYHLKSGSGRPARRALPVGALPPAWRAAIEVAVRRTAERAGIR